MGRRYIVLSYYKLNQIFIKAFIYFKVTFYCSPTLSYTAVVIISQIFGLPAKAQSYCIDDRFNKILFNEDQIEIISNIEYGTALNYLGVNEKLKLDIYRPVPSEDDLEIKPLILFIHGGGLIGGSSSTPYARLLGEEYAKRGFVFASIDYRLGWDNLENCGGDTLSLQLAFYRATQDARAALRYLKNGYSLFGIDTNYIFISGFSVGSSIAFNTAYAKQMNFYSYLYEMLGSIDSSGNTYYNHNIEVKGIIGKSTGIDSTDIFENENVPAILFHGTCDSVVIYETGPLYNCYSPVTYMYYHGSRDLADAMFSRGIPYHLYTNEGLSHESVSNDTLLLYSSEFIKDILCENLQTAEFYRLVNNDCSPLQNETKNLRPNPFQDYIQIDILTNESTTMLVSLFNAIGQQILSRSYFVTSPNAVITIDVSGVQMANGFYILRTEIGGKIHNYTLIKD